MTGAGPGRMPMKKPSTVPRMIGQMESFQSCRLGRRFLTLVVMISRLHDLFDIDDDLGHAEETHDGRDETHAVAEFKDPEGQPRVPEMQSMPIVLISSPKTTIIRAFRMDPEAR